MNTFDNAGKKRAPEQGLKVVRGAGWSVGPLSGRPNGVREDQPDLKVVQGRGFFDRAADPKVVRGR